MSRRVADLWERAKKALVVARSVLALDPDSTASRAYYAAFYAVSARLALDGKSYRKHSGVETAVHRDLVNGGVWPVELGQGYSRLSEARSTGDYGESEHITATRAAETIEIAGKVLQAIAREHPEVFPGLEDLNR